MDKNEQTQVPKYQIVIDWINEEIQSGRLKPGDRLMTEEAMAKKFHMSRQTIRRATQDLVNAKIISRVQGSGTYVGGMRAAQEGRRYMTVGVISTYCDEYIFPMVLRGIEKGLAKKGYDMRLAFTDNKSKSETRILKKLVNSLNVDGLIVEPSRSVLQPPNLEYYKELMEKNIPIVFFHDIYQGLDAPCIRLDDYRVAAEATKLLLWEGHTNIGAIFKLDDGQGPRRFAGYRDVMDKELDYQSKNVVWIDTYTQKNLAALGDYIFNRLESCTAILCYNDEVAAQLIDIALERGLRVPEDLSIVGIDNSPLSETGKVPFTSFDHPKEKLGEKVADNLLKLIENPSFDANYVFEGTPVYRNSVKRIR